jgi:meiotically up-regulated gene 157 (Mug157) protein
VITGDIDAMWLRDSSAQIWPYLPLIKEDPQLKLLIKGVIFRQTNCILLDPYANAFYKDVNKISEWKDDKTIMLPGIHERKWEVDSLCYPIRLAYGYWKATNDSSIFTSNWKKAMELVVQTFTEQQRFGNNGPYQFERTTSWATDGVPLGGFGYPTKKIGLIHSMFRPSDDATVFPFLIPSNIFASNALLQLAEMATYNNHSAIAGKAIGLKTQIDAAIKKYAVIQHPVFGKILAYEINGFGSSLFMDDANVPSLLSLPYLTGTNNEIFKNTRKFVLSEENPFFYKGKVAEGVGGPHAGVNRIWPLGIIMRGLTSASDLDIRSCLLQLQTTHAGTGFMHETFQKDNPADFTRKWFAWANTLFGEFIWKVYRERRNLFTQS